MKMYEYVGFYVRGAYPGPVRAGRPVSAGQSLIKTGKG